MFLKIDRLALKKMKINNKQKSKLIISTIYKLGLKKSRIIKY